MPDTQLQVAERLSAPSTGFVSFDRNFSSNPDDLVITFRSDQENQTLDAQLSFSKVRAYRERVEPYCTAWHVEGYDRVAEVVDSSWVDELVAATNTPTARNWAMRHFLMYIDSVGAIVVASSVALQVGTDEETVA